MSQAFAKSCNTTFAELSSRMNPTALTVAASQFGIGPDYTIEGLTTVTGTVPPTVDLTERTEDGFGQGKVLVTPFGMALAAATVAAGRTPTPVLIAGRQTAQTGENPPVDPVVLDGLRSMMRMVVTNGTAEGFSPAFMSQGAPRTVVASDGNRFWLITLEGTGDAGPTLSETASLLQQLGLRDALNLDGGSSTGLVMGGTMPVKGRGVAGSVHHGIGLVP